MAENRLMKDGLGKEAIQRISEALEKAFPALSKASFEKAALNGIEKLELKDRVRHLIEVLHQFLPDDFPTTAKILTDSRDNWDLGDPNDNLAGFAAWPIIDYIGEYGLDYPQESLQALKQLTPMFSAEFAIRPFLIHHTDLSLETILKWTTDPAEHIRRLVSEGSRPRLPWGQQLPLFIQDPAPVLNLLEKLKDDPSEYVRRSVANNLNDISKDHPDKVIDCCRRWKKDASPERQWIIRHATRSLVKAGHPQIFGLLGYTENPKLDFQFLEVSPQTINLGEYIEFGFQLQSNSSKPQTIVIDYAIHHVKANGKTSPKVFKFRTLKIAPEETVRLVKKHAIKLITTRKYYSGEHTVEILINGQPYGRTPFMLTC
jgi:3-methyladenine DNA glycosylase AlkC